MPVAGVQLLSNDALQGVCHPVLAGMLTGTIQVLVSNPFEAIKVRLQLAGPCGDAPALLRELGVDGLYRGWQGCAARDVTFSAVTFPTYAVLKDALPLEGPTALLLAGALAAGPAAYFSTPGDVISTRQKQGCGFVVRDVEDGMIDREEILCDVECDLEASNESAEPWSDVAARVYAEGGPAAFFRGAAERGLQHGPQMAVTLACFDVGMSACAANHWLAVAA